VSYLSSGRALYLYLRWAGIGRQEVNNYDVKMYEMDAHPHLMTVMRDHVIANNLTLWRPPPQRAAHPYFHRPLDRTTTIGPGELGLDGCTARCFMTSRVAQCQLCVTLESSEGGHL